MALRIAHLTPAYFAPESVIGGGERYVYNLAGALAAAAEEFDQCVISLGPAHRFFLYRGIPVRVLPNEHPTGEFLDGMSSALWRELDAFDIVHVHQSLSLFGAYAAAAARALRKTLVLTDLGGGETPLMLRGGGLNLADAVLSISHYARTLIAPLYEGPHHVIVGPVDTDAFSPGDPGETGGRREPHTAICVSRIMRHKGIDRVIRAVTAGLRLRVVGVVYDEPYYALLRELSATRDVVFIHDADDAALLELYRTSSLFVQASTTRDVYGAAIRKPELMGLTTLEAMSCGLPAIVSDAASLPELVPDPRFGRVFADEAELRALLEAFLRGDWPDAGAAALARAHVVAHHGIGAVGHRLAELYRSAHAHSAPGSTVASGTACAS